MIIDAGAIPTFRSLPTSDVSWLHINSSILNPNSNFENVASNNASENYWSIYSSYNVSLNGTDLASSAIHYSLQQAVSMDRLVYGDKEMEVKIIFICVSDEIALQRFLLERTRPYMSGKTLPKASISRKTCVYGWSVRCVQRACAVLVCVCLFVWCVM